MNKLDKTEQLVKDILESVNFQVNKIGESETKSPDFHVTLEDEVYIVEVKEKEDSPVDIEVMNESYDSGELFEVSHDLETKGNITKILSNANKQIKEVVVDENAFRIAWIHCSGVHCSATEEQVLSTIYGIETLWDTSDSGISGKCYYFNHSSLYRYKESLDAVVITTKNNTIRVCLNTFSTKYEQIKNSKIVEAFSEGVLDPITEESNKHGFLADTDINRNDKDAVLSYLEDKYSTDKLIIFPMQYHAASIFVKD